MVSLKEMPSTGIYVIVFLVIMVIGGIIVNDIRDDQITGETKGITNQTVSIVAANTFYNLGNSQISNSSVIVTNATDGSTVSSSSYAINDLNGYILVSDETYAGSSVNVSYSYAYENLGYAANISSDGLDALDNMSEQSDTLTTVIIFGVILGILIGVFFTFVR